MIARLFQRKAWSPYSEERLSDPNHVRLIVYEIKTLAEKALEEGRPEHLRPSPHDLGRILYLAAYLLSYEQSPLAEMAVSASFEAAGRQQPRIRRDGRDEYERGRRDGTLDRSRLLPKLQWLDHRVRETAWLIDEAPVAQWIEQRL
jgi:hypothetical protein